LITALSDGRGEKKLGKIGGIRGRTGGGNAKRQKQE